MFHLTFVNKTRRHCHSWLEGQWAGFLSHFSGAIFVNIHRVFQDHVDRMK